MTDYQAGDDVRVRLRVVPDDDVPADGTTQVTAVAYLDGEPPRTLDPQPADGDRSRWSAILTATPAGVWRIVWTVSGTGAGVQTFDLPVGPGRGPTAGRSYATTAQLAEHMHAAPPLDARVLLLRATGRVDELLRTAVYAVTDDGLDMPTDPVVAAALAEATCAQAVWFADLGDDGTGTAQHYGDVKIGSVALSTRGGAGEGASGRYAPGAVEALRRVPGLYGAPPVVAW